VAVDNKRAPGVFAAAEQALYLEWKQHGRHIEEYASEFVGTAFHIFAVVVVVGIMFAPHAEVAALVPPKFARLFIAGLLIGGSGALVAISPFGRLSGGHINPAISLGFWTLGKMHPKDLAGYVISQMLGGLLGVFAAARLIPSLGASVRYAFLTPSAGLNSWGTFGLEVLATFCLGSVIFYFVANQRLMRFTPLAVMVTAGILVMCDGAFSGACLNPARWFGPAAILANWSLGWAYVAGPIAGALLAAAVRHHPKLPTPHLHTCKLFHDAGYRSIFKHESAASTPPRHIRGADSAESRTTSHS
jgi:aquaporin Z